MCITSVLVVLCLPNSEQWLLSNWTEIAACLLLVIYGLSSHTETESNANEEDKFLTLTIMFINNINNKSFYNTITNVLPMGDIYNIIQIYTGVIYYDDNSRYKRLFTWKLSRRCLAQIQVLIIRQVYEIIHSSVSIFMYTTNLCMFYTRFTIYFKRSEIQMKHALFVQLFYNTTNYLWYIQKNVFIFIFYSLLMNKRICDFLYCDNINHGINKCYYCNQLQAKHSNIKHSHLRFI